MNAKQAVKELSSGYSVTVTPLTGLFVKALEVQAARLHPKPDLDAYRKELTSTLKAGKKTDDATTQAFPEYQAALQDWVMTVRFAKMGLALDVAVDHPDKAALIAKHAPHIQLFKDALDDKTRAILVSDWVCVLFMFLAAEEEEIGALYAIAVGATPLSDGEISDGLAFFR